MAEVQLTVGMASKYFVTEFDTALALMGQPYLIVSSQLLTLEHWAESLIAIQPKSSQGSQNDISKTLIFLADLIHDQKNSMSINITKPLFIFSNGIQREALASMKVLQLRRICQILAIDGSALKFAEAAGNLDQNFKVEEVYKNEDLHIYLPTQKCNVVGGIYKTLLSTDKSIKEAIAAHPEIVQTGGMHNMNEPIL